MLNHYFIVKITLFKIQNFFHWSLDLITLLIVHIHPEYCSNINWAFYLIKRIIFEELIHIPISLAPINRSKHKKIFDQTQNKILPSPIILQGSEIWKEAFGVPALWNEIRSWRSSGEKSDLKFWEMRAWTTKRVPWWFTS